MFFKWFGVVLYFYKNLKKDLVILLHNEWKKQKKIFGNFFEQITIGVETLFWKDRSIATSGFKL